jgi:hypothetical protein
MTYIYNATATKKLEATYKLLTARINRTNAVKDYAEKLARAVALARAVESGDGNMPAADEDVTVAVASVAADIKSALDTTVIPVEINEDVIEN